MDVDARLLGQGLAAAATAAGAQGDAAGDDRAPRAPDLRGGGRLGARQESQPSADSSRKRLTASARSKTSQRSSSPLSTRASETGMAGHDAETPFRAVGGVGEGVDGRDLERQLDAPDAGQVDGQAQQVGPARQRGQGPGEGQREVELVGRLLLLGEQHDGVLEGEQDAGVDVEGEVQVERAAAPLLGVQVDLPDLAQGVGLDEVPLVVHVKSVVDRVVLQVGDVAGDVNGCHNPGSLPGGGPAHGR